MAKSIGKICQVIGPVVDIAFDKEGSELPNIMDALEIKHENGEILVVECQQHIGENTIRGIAMDSTDGLQRGMKVVATGNPIKMPIGEQIRGRLMNVIGEPIDGIGPLDRKTGYPIHRKPPKYEELSVEKEVLYTGIKVVDRDNDISMYLTALDSDSKGNIYTDCFSEDGYLEVKGKIMD